MSAVGLAVERTEVDGVPVFYADAPAPFTAALVFRVGRADESLATAGLTHLVEHLALFPLGRTSFFANGTVDDLWTCFFASGTAAEATAFLNAVARNLSSLPLDRIEVEKRVLLTEEASRPSAAYLRVAGLRYGRRSFGLASHPEYGLRRVARDEVTQWAGKYFVKENAAVWMTGPPDGLEVILPSGERAAPPSAEPLPELALPCQLAAGAGRVSIGMVGERSTALSVAFGVALMRAHARLRLDSGLSYDTGGTYEPVGPNLAHLVLGADCLDPHARKVRDDLLDVLRGLAEAGPTEDELDQVRAERGQILDDPAHARGWLDYLARETVLGGAAPSPADLQAELEALTAAESAEAVGKALASAIILAPTGTPRPPGYADYGDWSKPPVRGRTFRQTPLRIGRNAKVVASEEGVTLFSLDEEEPITILLGECVAVLRWSPNRITLLALDGAWIELRARTLRGGHRLVREVLGRLPEELVIPMEDVQTQESLVELAVAKLGRTHVLDQFKKLPEHLLPGERVENLAQIDEFTSRGLLVLTDRRLLYLSRRFVIRSERVREVARADIRGVEGSERRARLRGRLDVQTNNGTITFARFAKRARAVEFRRALADQADS